MKSTSPLAPLRLYQRDGHYGLTENNEISRLSVAVKVNNRYVGTLNTGLSVDPGIKLDDKMMQWAQSANSELVQYVRNEFAAGGPFADAAVSARSTKRKVQKVPEAKHRVKHFLDGKQKPRFRGLDLSALLRLAETATQSLDTEKILNNTLDQFPSISSASTWAPSAPWIVTRAA